MVLDFRWTQEEIEKKVESYRTILIGQEEKPSVPTDEFGRVV